MDVTVRKFVEKLWCLKSDNHNKIPNNFDLLHYGHVQGWLEDQDEVHPDSILVRRSAARILHEFMKIELKISDIQDISAANELKDLYTCRVCVNHVAQIYLRKLIPAEEIEFQEQQILIFNMMKAVSEKEMEEIFQKIESLYQ